MATTPYFICECGSDVLAVSHTWIDKRGMEEVGFVQEDGQYRFDEPLQVKHEHLNDEWIAYCGDCGKGVTVEWLSDNKLRVILDEEKQA